MTYKAPSLAELQALCDAFNAECRVGGRVALKRDGTDKPFITTTRSDAQILSGHSAVVWMNGVSGCYQLSHVTPIPDVVATVTLTGNQMRAALAIINPDGPADEDQCGDDLTFGIVQHRDDNGKVETGMCCWNDDTGGVIPLPDEYPAPAPVAAQPAPKECWSNDEETFNYDSLAELLAEHDKKPGDTVWKGMADHPKARDLISVPHIIEDLGEEAYDIAGEYAEGYPDVSEAQAAELELLICDWINRTCPPKFWRVQDIKPYVLTADDFPKSPE